MVLPCVHYHYRGITMTFSPFTAVTADLPFTPLPCHSLVPIIIIVIIIETRVLGFYKEKKSATLQINTLLHSVHCYTTN